MSITASTAVGQQSYRPPVHVSPNQQYNNASNRYAGIAALESNARPNQPVQSEQYYQEQAPVTENRSPHLQARIANAFSGLGNRRQDRRAQSQTQQRQPQRRQQVVNEPTPVQQYASSAQPEEREEVLEYVPPQVRNQPVRERAPTPVQAHPRPVEEVVQRRAAPQRYPVQLIETEKSPSVMERVTSPEQEYAETVVPDPYYDQPSIQVTSAQEFDAEVLPALETQERVVIRELRQEEPVRRVTQTPVYPPIRQRPKTKARPISILNTPNEGTIDPRFGVQEDEDERMEVENSLRESYQEIDEPEDITGDEDEDEDDLLEELPERERQQLDKSCGELRYDLLNDPITSIAVDISPPRSELVSPTGAEYRTWTDQFGRTVGSGSVATVRRGYALVQANGGYQKVPVGNMSDADLAAMSSYWQLPSECTISTSSFTGRNWIPQTVTWKASNLCHKPLFFENIQLERYGHSHGPFTQPIHSAVHFFTSLALVPYNSGITPANECQYALGFYRPGNCAPWLREPFPISLAGAQNQAAAVTAGAFLFFP